ncbi:MAG: helix-hairpin-helix domain-containing protein, partial [Fibrobacteraceae bacterium]|nr:helix-hairpin-helix domain-containing protein [Fibrobacteraceae bacterium]
SIENAEVITENEKIERKIKQKTKKKTKISFPIAINTASLEVLCAIPGVGPKMAEKIITYRKTHGPLKKEADLLKISGIGKKKSKIILKSIKFD